MTYYITAEELRVGIGFQVEVMASITPDEPEQEAGSAFAAVLSDVIKDQTKLIDDWIIAKTKDIESLRNNQILRRICLNLSRYEMYLRFARDMVPETVQADKDESMRQLEKIQRGEIELLAETPETLAISEFSEGQTQLLNTPLF